MRISFWYLCLQFLKYLGNRFIQKMTKTARWNQWNQLGCFCGFLEEPTFPSIFFLKNRFYINQVAQFALTDPVMQRERKTVLIYICGNFVGSKYFGPKSVNTGDLMLLSFYTYLYIHRTIMTIFAKFHVTK